ncbi:MAG: hypothetical protein ACLSWI_07905 [Candidatus Gastranaerophilaceae bacterium]
MPPPRNASRGKNEMIVERQSTETRSLRCCREWCYLSRAGVVAFTLAEVLITLGIIGVVAALTIPNVIANHQKRVTAKKVEKAYTELNQIISQAKAEHGDPSGWDYYGENDLEMWVKTYIVPYTSVEKSEWCNQSSCIKYPFYNTHPLGNTNYIKGGYIVAKNKGVPAIRFFRHGDVYETVTRTRVYINSPYKEHSYLGKDVFTFIFDRREKNPHFRPYIPHQYGLYNPSKPHTYHYPTKEELLGTGWGCCNKKASGSGNWGPGDACAAVIMLDNWEIKDGYPW